MCDACSPTQVHLTGRLICADAAQALAVATHLPDHIRLSRAEPGCLRFDVTPAGPLVWQVDEIYADRDSFAAHQARTQGSDWFRATAQVKRDYTISGWGTGWG